MNETKIDRDNVVVWNDGKENTCAWVNGGSTGWFLTPEDKAKPAETLWREIKAAWNNGDGVYRCTSCGIELHKTDVVGWPLFAGCACFSCWEKHLEHGREEVKRGHVCRMCHKPYSQCCC